MAKNFSSNLGDADILSQYPSAASPLSIDELLKARAIGAPPASWGGGWPAQPDAAQAPAAPAPPAAPPTPTARDRAMSGLSSLQSNLDRATSAVDDIPVDNPQVADLDKRIAAESTPTQLRERPEGDTSPQGTGKMLPQFAPTMGQRIWRGVRSGLVGLATGGIPGAVVGALEPQDIAGGTAYGDPNQTYQRIEAGRQADLDNLQNQRKSAADAWKQAVDARKTRATEFRANAALGKDISTGATDVMKADNDADKNANETPEAKARTKALEDANTYNDRMGRLGTLERRVGKLPPQTEAYYLANGKLPDPKQPHEPSFEEIALAGALRTLGHKPSHDEYMQIVRDVRGRAGGSDADERFGQGKDLQLSKDKEAALDKARAAADQRYWTPDAKAQYVRAAQAAQDAYENGLRVLGRAPQHLVVNPDTLEFEPASGPTQASQPAKSGQQSGQFAVQVGSDTYHFPTQEAANKFKAAAGL